MDMRAIRILSGYRFLFFSLLALLVIYPLLSIVERAAPWIDAIVYVTLLAGILAAQSSRLHLGTATAIGLLTFAFLHFADVNSTEWVLVTSYMLGTAFFGYLGIHILRDIFFRRQTVTGELIYGALAVYLLIGVAFAFAYQLFDHLDTDAFENTGLLAGSTIQAFEGFLYFSFVTMTTLGFGDITAHTAQAGAFVTAQAIIGQMYLTVLVARLVSLQITHQVEEEQ